MKGSTRLILDQLLERYPAMQDERPDIEKAFAILKECYERDNKLLICGNGGSSSDADHIVGELMKSFNKKRPIPLEEQEELKKYGDEGKQMAEKLEGTLMAISLGCHAALSSAFLNDKDPYLVYAQQVQGYGRKGDVLMAISTSGNSRNCVYAAEVAKVRGLDVIALTGKAESHLSKLGDVTIHMPVTETYKVQEYTLPVYHALCSMLEEEFF